MINYGGERGRRALTWIALASVGLLAAAVLYLRASPTYPPATQPVRRAAASQQTGTPVFFNVSFGDARHGVVQVYSQNNPNLTGPIYLTSDGGRTWRRLVAKRPVPIAAVIYVDGQRMLAEEFGSGLQRLLVSDDRGRTWQPLALDPRQSIVTGFWPVFLGSYGWWLDWQPQPVPSPPPSPPVRLWRTSDGGRIWVPATPSGIPPFDSIDQVRFIDHLHGLLAMVSDDQRRAIVAATSDGGDTWQTAAAFDPAGAGMRPLGMVLLRHGARLLAWSAFSAWDPRTGGPLPLESPAVGTFASVSEDNGATWGPVRTGPVTAVPYGAAAVVDDKGRLLLLEGRRLWISDDDGASWVARVAMVPPGMVPVFMSAAVPGSIYAVAVRSSGAVRIGNEPAELLRSSDGGIHWTEVHLPA